MRKHTVVVTFSLNRPMAPKRARYIMQEALSKHVEGVGIGRDVTRHNMPEATIVRAHVKAFGKVVSKLSTTKRRPT